jgi:hypothetical protein
MSVRITSLQIKLSVLALCAVVALKAPLAGGQQPKQPEAGAAAPAKDAAADAARKHEILTSAAWRRAMFEFKEWLSAQQLYDAKQVEQIKRDFNARVAAMTADEVQYLLADMQAKFQILDSPQAQEARAWMASYLAVMSNKKKAEVLKDLPNVATMTAAQLNQELLKIEQKRTTIEQEQAAFQSTRQAEVSQQLATDRLAQQNYIRDRNAFPTSSYSPYRSDASTKKPYSDYRGPQMGYYVNPWGGVGITFSPSSW